jgi:hypothetical protein
VLKPPELEKYDVSIPLPPTIPKTPKVEIKEADLFDHPNCIVNVGTNCKRKGCGHIYAEGSKDTECNFHTGEPIFHEGLKGWTCCTFILIIGPRRVLEFDEFLNIPKCATSKHRFQVLQSNPLSIRMILNGIITKHLPP